MKKQRLNNRVSPPDYGEMKNVMQKIHLDGEKGKYPSGTTVFKPGKKACSTPIVQRKGDPVAIQ